MLIVWKQDARLDIGEIKWLQMSDIYPTRKRKG